MTFFAHLMLSRNLISPALSSSRPRPWEARWQRPCQAIPASSAVAYRTPVPSWGPWQQQSMFRNHPQKGTPRVYRAREFPVLRSRDTKKQRGRAPYQRGWGRWMVRSGWGWSLVLPGFSRAIGWRYGRFHPHMQPYSFDETRLGLVWETETAPVQHRENDIDPIDGCFGAKRTSCVTDFRMMLLKWSRIGVLCSPFLHPVLLDGQQQSSRLC